MERIAAFFISFFRGLKETFSDDATGKLSWQAFLGVYLLYVIGEYVQRTSNLSDGCFIAIIALQALFIYGPTANLAAYFKGLFGGFKVPETQNNIQNNTGTSSSSQLGSEVSQIPTQTPASE